LIAAADGVGVIGFADTGFAGLIGGTSTIFGAGIAVFALCGGALAVTTRVGGCTSVVHAALAERTSTIEGASAAIFAFVGFARSVATAWKVGAKLLVAVAAFSSRTTAVDGARGAGFVFVGVANTVTTIGSGQACGSVGVAQFAARAGAIERAVETVFLGRVADAIAATDGGLQALSVEASLETTIGLTISDKVASIDGMNVTIDTDRTGGLAGASVSAEAFAAPQETGLIGRTIGATGAFFLADTRACVTKEAFAASLVCGACAGGCSATFAKDKHTYKKKKADQRPTYKDDMHGSMSSFLFETQSVTSKT
jgi:hypothetical protein